ncbi:hypothetical protein I4U23_024099 [Adineta vaga]|nr:hypothetical protein I4U23_024099 [Adineta vaga]
MLSNDSLPTVRKPTLSLRSSSSVSASLFSPCKDEEKHQQSDNDETTSTDTVVRHTTSWRWMIVFGSFGAHFVADGVLFSFGILMHMIKDDLKIELHTVGIIASLFVSLPLFLAPLSSALVNRIGCRCMTMLGGFLCSAGLFIASMLGNFVGALIGIGIICGTGLSFVYVPAVVIVAHYFDENRAIATALAVGGTGLGNAVVAQIIHILNDYYSDWRDTTLLLSGVLFTIVGFGALFRPVEFSFQRTNNKHYEKTMIDHRLPPNSMTSIEKLQHFVKEMDQQCATRQAQQSVSISTSNHETPDIDLFDSYSADDIRELEDEFDENFQVKIPLSKFRHFQRSQTTSDKPLEKKSSSTNYLSRFYSLPHEQQDKQLLEVYYQPISQKDIFYPGDVPVKSSSLTQASCPNLIQSYFYEESETIVSDDDSDSNHSQHHHHVFYRKGLTFWNTLRRMLGLQLFRDYRYMIFFISQFLFYLFYDLIYLFPVDYGETVIGYDKKQMTMLVTILGLGQFFGQIFYGLLANYSGINEMIFYNIGAVLCGVASILIPFVAKSYIALIMIILLFGLSVSANYALTSIILANMCGIELLTSAYGLILLGQGLSSLAGPVIGGWIAERYGYKSSLIIAGIFMGVSGFVTLLIPLIQRLLLGTWNWNEELNAKAQEAFNVSLSKEINTFDIAEIYSHMEKASKFNQIEYSLLRRSSETFGHITECHKRGVAVLGYFPLVSLNTNSCTINKSIIILLKNLNEVMGHLTGKYSKSNPAPSGCYFSDIDMNELEPLSETIRRIADQHIVSVSSVALNYVIYKGVISRGGARDGLVLVSFVIFTQQQPLSNPSSDEDFLWNKRMIYGHSSALIPRFRGSNLGIFVRKRPSVAIPEHSVNRRIESRSTLLNDENIPSEFRSNHEQRHSDDYSDNPGPMFGR